MRPGEAYKPQDTGRMAFREPGEAPDGRLVINRGSFWESEDERLTYEHATEANPPRPGEGALSRMLRVASIAEGRMLRMEDEMPRKRRMSQDEHQRRVNDLQAQAKELLKDEPVVVATPERKAELLAAIGWQGQASEPERGQREG